MTPNGHQTPFSTDDLREALLEDTPQEGFDGEEMLALARRSRVTRRVGAGAIMAVVAVVIALAVMVGSGTVTRRDITIHPATQSAEPSVATESPSLPATSPAPTRTPSSSSPAPVSSGSSSTSGPGSSPVTRKVTALCEASDQALRFTAAPRGFLGRLGDTGVTLTATQTVLTATTSGGSSRRVLQIPANQALISASTDGRHALIEVAHSFGSEDPATDVYLWDSRSGGQATKLLSLTSGAGVSDLRNGVALILDGEQGRATTVHRVDLATGTVSAITPGRVVEAAFLTSEGRVILSAPGTRAGAQVFDSAGNAVVNPSGQKWYGPLATTGDVSIHVTGFNDEASTRVYPTVVFGPAFAAPLVVTAKRTVARAPQIGTNFALVRETSPRAEAGLEYHLVDLRTGGRVRIGMTTSPGEEPDVRLMANDMLVRDPMSTAAAEGAFPNPGWVDLSKVTLTC